MASELRKQHRDGVWYTRPGAKYVVCRSTTEVVQGDEDGLDV